MSMFPAPTPEPFGPRARATFDSKLQALKRRLVQEAASAVAMVEGSLDALWNLDGERAREVRLGDDRIDREEVAIEQECFQLLALEQPMASDFRKVAFVLKVNADVERIGDHASGIAKVCTKLDRAHPPSWPVAIKELGKRLPAQCHRLLRAILDEDVAEARGIIAADEVIDELEKQVFEETVQLMRHESDQLGNGLLLYRLGREMERIGDLLKSIAEDIVYLGTGEIVRHEKRREPKG